MKQTNARRFAYIAYTTVPTVALALLMGTTASAHGWGWAKTQNPEELAQRQQQMFQEQADLLGTGVDTVKNAWAQGKTFVELAKDLGLSETDLNTKMQEARKAEIKNHLQTLVSQGVITQTQADQRYAFMEQRANITTPGRGRMMLGGWGRHGPGF